MFTTLHQRKNNKNIKTHNNQANRMNPRINKINIKSQLRNQKVKMNRIQMK
jgi:hypothetical protein